jgi:processing peptidase subunit beta
MRKVLAHRRLFSSLAPIAQQPTVVTSLPNQLRVASEATGGETATVGVWIDTGSRYETDANNGVAHFLEHMAFKGTSKRTQLQLETEVENMGAHLNAYTSREQTVYYAKVLKKDVPVAVEMMSDILLNSTFSPQAVERERDVILREMEEVEGQVEEVVFDRLHEVAYVGTPLARTILGPVVNIKSISCDDIEKYIKTHYTAPRMVLVGAGAVNHDQLHKLGDQYFGGVPTTAPDGLAFEDMPSLFSGSDFRDYNDDASHTNFALSFEGLPWTHPDVFTLMLCQSLLGTYDSKSAGNKHSAAPMVATLAKHPHVAELVQPFCTCYNDTGLFGVYVQAKLSSAEDGSDLMQIIQDEMVSLTTGVSDDDLARGKDQLKFNMLQQMDGTSPTAEEIGRQLLTLGRRMNLAETFERIDAIEVSDVSRVAENIIWDQEVSFAAVGSKLKYIGDINSLRSGTFWNRY